MTLQHRNVILALRYSSFLRAVKIRDEGQNFVFSFWLFIYNIPWTCPYVAIYPTYGLLILQIQYMFSIAAFKYLFTFLGPGYIIENMFSRKLNIWVHVYLYAQLAERANIPINLQEVQKCTSIKNLLTVCFQFLFLILKFPNICLAVFRIFPYEHCPAFMKYFYLAGFVLSNIGILLTDFFFRVDSWRIIDRS